MSNIRDLNPGGGQQSQGQQIQITPEMMESATDVVCENCNGQYFETAVQIKKLSPIMLGLPKEAVQPIYLQVMRCMDCGTPLKMGEQK
jgi:hypothetical protein